MADCRNKSYAVTNDRANGKPGNERENKFKNYEFHINLPRY